MKRFIFFLIFIVTSHLFSQEHVCKNVRNEHLQTSIFSPVENTDISYQKSQSHQYRDMMHNFNFIPENHTQWLFEKYARCAQWPRENFWHAFAQLCGEKVYAGYGVSDARLVPGVRIDGYDYYFWPEDIDKIMQQWKLYDYNGFWNFIKELPDYENRLKKYISY
jgi:hypothetical protein